MKGFFIEEDYYILSSAYHANKINSFSYLKYYQSSLLAYQKVIRDNTKHDEGINFIQQVN